MPQFSAAIFSRLEKKIFYPFSGCDFFMLRGRATKQYRIIRILCAAGLLLGLGACGGGGSSNSLSCFELDADTRGCSERAAGILAISLVSNDATSDPVSGPRPPTHG